MEVTADVLYIILDIITSFIAKYKQGCGFI